MTEYPIAVVNRAKEIWLAGQGGMPLPFADVAKRLNTELNLQITRKCITEWSKRFAWADSPELADSAPPPAGPASAPGGVGSAPAPPVEPAEDGELEPWEWEEQKLKFLGKLAGIAGDCLAVGTGPDGQPAYLFKDTEARIKTGLAAVEMIGKINSGKFDRQEKDDVLPALTKSQLGQMFSFFFVQGSPEPRIDSLPVLDAETFEIEPKAIEAPAPEVEAPPQ